MTTKKLKLLIIDDEELIGRILSDFFEDFGIKVSTATNGAQALKKINEETFDGAIIDMRLPDTTGDELILKINKINPKINFFIHTGSLDYKIPEELKKIGIKEDQIIFKPITDMEEIYQRIIKGLS